MHFLCLHGLGTNSYVFETQTATLRHDMDKHDTFDFAEAGRECPIAEEISTVFPSKDIYYRYYWNEAADLSLALQELDKYIKTEGPFDGVMAFSQGAGLVSTYIVQQSQDNPTQPLPFRCAIFLSAARPFDPQALKGGDMRFLEIRELAPLNLATAHIWGEKDIVGRDQAAALAQLCDPAKKVVYLHGGAHEIPGPRAKSDVQGSLRAIRRTVDAAQTET